MIPVNQAVSEFLSGRRIAVTGVSRSPKDHGANVVYTRLRDRGYTVFAVNPNAETVEGDPAYPDLRSIEGGVDGVVIGTSPERADRTVRECVDLGIQRIWMHRGRAGQRLPDRHGVRPAARAHRDRGRLPVHVRPDRRHRAQGDAAGRPRAHGPPGVTVRRAPGAG